MKKIQQYFILIFSLLLIYKFLFQQTTSDFQNLQQQFLKLTKLKKCDVNKKNTFSTTSATKHIMLKEAMYYQKLKNNKVQCLICFRKCIIAEGKVGFCRTKQNIQGKLYSLVYSQPSAVQIDPIEKEPLYHFLPGSTILCIGTAGCNLKCKHCHNWHLSQVSPNDIDKYYLPPQTVVEIALKNNIKTISFTYNDPIVFYEYVYDIAKLAKQHELKIVLHTNAAINPSPLKELLKYVDAVTVDLKSISTKIFREMSEAEVEPVLESLKIIKQSGCWLEIVNLIVTGRNDSENHITELCLWIKKNLGSDVPLHFTRFFPNYKYTNVIPTPPEKLETAYNIARKIGLNYVYIGNLPGHKYNSTFCVKCNKRLIYRIHFEVKENNIVNGRCKFCNTSIVGVWN
ncbi:MAG: AmmeMemoRadiSam system radical SAM enzyme [Endomicrobiia bacterium]